MLAEVYRPVRGRGDREEKRWGKGMNVGGGRGREREGEKEGGRDSGERAWVGVGEERNGRGRLYSRNNDNEKKNLFFCVLFVLFLVLSTIIAHCKKTERRKRSQKTAH